jgi:two-component system, sensor histidine kinase and response regulator
VKHILIADDKPGSREFLRTVLEHSGYQVTEAADGEEALAQASLHQIDLFLLDLQMPKLDGIGLVKQLRQRAELSGVPMVALTASAMQGDRERALAAGFSAYLAKPVSLPLLRSELARLLGVL